jgi:hypothetical protein
MQDCMPLPKIDEFDSFLLLMLCVIIDYGLLTVMTIGRIIYIDTQPANSTEYI